MNIHFAYYAKWILNNFLRWYMMFFFLVLRKMNIRFTIYAKWILDFPNRDLLRFAEILGSAIFFPRYLGSVWPQKLTAPKKPEKSAVGILTAMCRYRSWKEFGIKNSSLTPVVWSLRPDSGWNKKKDQMESAKKKLLNRTKPNRNRTKPIKKKLLNRTELNRTDKKKVVELNRTDAEPNRWNWFGSDFWKFEPNRTEPKRRFGSDFWKFEPRLILESGPNLSFFCPDSFPEQF